VKVLQAFDLVRYNAEGNPELSSLLKDIDPKSAQTIDLVTHIDLSIFDETLLLPIVHQTEGHLRQIIMIESFCLTPWFQNPIDPEDRGRPFLDMDIRGFLRQGLH
jgi:hypothetical protein